MSKADVKNSTTPAVVMTDPNSALAGFAPLYSAMNLNTIQVSKPIQSTGARGPPSFNCYVGAGNRKPFRFQMTLSGTEFRPNIVFPMDAPTSAATRVNVALSVTANDPGVLKFWADIDSIMIKHLAEHSKEFLKKKMTPKEIREIYIPCVRTKDDFEPYLKIRFDTAIDSRTPFSCWDINESAKRFSKLHYSRLGQGDSVLVIIQPGMLYNFSGKVGCTIDCSHMVRFAPPPANDFPFQLGVDGIDYHQVSPDDLFSDKNIAIIDKIVQQHEAKKLIELVPEDDGDDDGYDGSTVKLDPITLEPLTQKRSARHIEDQEEEDEGDEDDANYTKSNNKQICR
jgi:hypothetical protein